MPNEQIERQNWRAEQLICVHCEHTWDSPFPEEALNVECPRCRAMSGIPIKKTENGSQNRG